MIYAADIRDTSRRSEKSLAAIHEVERLRRDNARLRERLRLASKEAHAENVLAGGAHQGEWARCPHSDCAADRAALASLSGPQPTDKKEAP